MRLICALLVVFALAGAFAADPVEVPVPRPEPLLAMDLGGGLSSYIISSHLWTGWARYLETVPAKRLLEGIGSWTAIQNLQNPEEAETRLPVLHDYGIGVFRYEIGWGNLVFSEDEDQPARLNLDVEARYRAVLRSAKRHGFRLIMLLDAHQGAGCPLVFFDGRLMEAAPKGATELTLLVDRPELLKVGYSGINGLTDYCAAEGLFTSIQHLPAADANAYRVTLSKALPRDYAAGEQVGLARLQYRPFGDPASEEATYAGWGKYADLVARIAAEEGLPDGQVDFELWNELTFGTMFLSIHNYDATLEGGADINRMLQVGAKVIRKYFPDRTAVINGFSNTSFFFNGFWGSARPAGVDGESYHPYGNVWRQFPDFAVSKDNHLAEGFRNPEGYIPAYGTLYPEYKGAYITSHSLICLMQPEMRQAMVASGHAPEGWKRGFTEDGIFLPEVNAPEPYANKLRERPEYYVSKWLLRLYPFFLNKGLSYVCDGSLRNPGDWAEGWEAKFWESGDERYLAALLPVRRLTKLLAGAEDISTERLIQLHPKVTQLTGQDKVIFGTEGAYIIQRGAEGRPWDPSKVEPRPFTYADSFCMLPFQVDDDSLVVGLYIQTRNALEDVDDAGTYRIAFSDLLSEAQVRCYDPLKDRNVPLEVQRRPREVTVTLTLTDYPIFLVLDGVDGPRGLGPLMANLR